MSFSSITANLLAEENLKVIQTNDKTASFTVDDRVLRLPTLTEEFDDVTDMMVCHEVGHALFTDETFIEVFKNASSIKRMYYNVCEDARIEKLIKRKYPGLRKVMAVGYNKFIESGMFIPQGMDVNTMSLIDRINVYFKTTIPVRFTVEEKVLVERVAAAETVEEIMEISETLYDLSKNGSDDRLQEVMEMLKSDGLSDDEGDDEYEESDDSDEAEESDDSDDSDEAEESDEDEETEDEDEDESSWNSNGSSSEDESEAERSLTMESLEEALSNAVDTDTKVVSYTLQRNVNHEIVVPYNVVIEDVERSASARYHNEGHMELLKANYDSFMTGTNRVVNYMVKEFEMKKAAHQLRHSRQARSGRLNMNKVFAYQLRDDLFSSITITPDAQNHGMVFLLDWSGSMSNVLHNTITQLIALTSFCRKAKIPHRVYAFANPRAHLVNENREAVKAKIAAQPDYTLLDGYGVECSLLEFMNDSMSDRDYNKMAFQLFSGITQYAYSLTGTPLDSALVYMHSFLNEYKRAHAIEKMTLVVLSDGASNHPLVKSTTSSGEVRVSYPEKTYRSHYSACRVMVTDPITKRVHSLRGDNYTGLLLEMIKSSSNVDIIGIFVADNNGIGSGLRTIYRDQKWVGDSWRVYNKRQLIMSEWRKSGFAVESPLGYDTLYMVKDSSLKIKEYEAEINSNQSAAQVAREMAKMNKSSVSNRVLMGRIIGNFS